MLAGSAWLNSPWFSKKRAVSVCSGSMTTRNFSFESAVIVFFRLSKQ
jgi:hypothetical protein